MRAKFITIAAGAALVTVLAWTPAVLAQQKTVKQCRADWTLNKAAIAASGKTQRAFVAECRGVPFAGRSTPAADFGQGQYANETDAKTACGSDAVVWVNLRSRAYHEAGSRRRNRSRQASTPQRHLRDRHSRMLPSQPPADPDSRRAGACFALRRGDKGGGEGG